MLHQYSASGIEPMCSLRTFGITSTEEVQCSKVSKGSGLLVRSLVVLREKVLQPHEDACLSEEGSEKERPLRFEPFVVTSLQ